MAEDGGAIAASGPAVPQGDVVSEILVYGVLTMRTICQALSVIVLAVGVSKAELVEANLLSVGSATDMSARPVVYQPVSDYSVLRDGSLGTTLNIVGDEYVYNPNPVDADAGAGLRLEFSTPVEAMELHLDLWLRSYVPPGSLHASHAACMSLDETYGTHHSVASSDDNILHFSGRFDSLGNSFSDKPTDTIGDVRLPGNRFQVTLWGPYLDGLHDNGPQGLIVYEVHAWYEPVPEPAALLLLAFGGLAVTRRRVRRVGVAVTSSVLGALLLAATSAGAVNIDIVVVGNPGNAGELSGQGATPPLDRICGAVAYVYQIGKFEITAGQYCQFLNAVAKTDTNSLYNAYMWEPDPSGDYSCKIQRTGSSGSYTYSVASGWANRPVTYVSWGDAARFCNWMHNGQPTGAQDLTTTEDGSYYLSGATTNNALLAVTRKTDATWVIPSEDEWYKAAYHKNDGVTGNYWDYPTGSDVINTSMANYGSPSRRSMDVGSYGGYPSPYGTFDQAGNVWEWNEEKWDDGSVYAIYRGLRGGSFDSADGYIIAVRRSGCYAVPEHENRNSGFRLAYVPEPAAFLLLGLGGLTLIQRRQ